MASTSALLRPASSSAISKMLIAMESSCMTCLTRTYHASPALPADLQDFAVFDKHRNGPLPAGFAHANECIGVGVPVEFDELTAREFQPLTHLPRVRPTRRAEEFKHRQLPPAPRAANDRWTLGFPECVEYSRSERSAGSRPGPVSYTHL